MNSLRVGFGTAVLTDGRVQVLTSYRNWTYEIFDPSTGTWTQEAMPALRGNAWHPSVMLLPDGTVLYVSPEYGDVLVYNPVTSSWTAGPTFNVFQDRSDVTLLRDGKVLFAGHDPINPHTSCALYDWQNGTINATGSLNSEHGVRAVEALLPNGEVLIVGGFTNRKGAEIYDPVAMSWRRVPNTMYDRHGGTGIRLPPPWNKILFIGPFASMTETFDPNSETWADAGALVNSGRAIPTTIMLPSGKPIVIGGQLNRTCEVYDPVAQTWTLADSMSCPRAHFSSCILHTGKILSIGGFSMTPSDTIKTVEIYDTTESVWTNKPTLFAERAGHATTPLPIIATSNCSTNILVVGGENGTGFLKSCELYNYVEEDVDITGELNEARAYHGVNLLVDGTVLVCGGKNSVGALSSSELYSAGTGSWTATAASMTAPRFNHTATLLSNGSVFITGGEDGATILPSCEMFISGMWLPANPMANERTEHSCALLLDGTILVVGGRTNTGVTNTCEIYSPVTGNWSPAANLTVGRCLHTTVLLQSGRVLVIGGDSGGGSPIASCEIYDPATGLWSQAPSLNVSRYSHNSALIYSGLVLISGGYNGATFLSSCEVYDPCIPIAYAPNWKLTVPLNTGRAFHSSCNIAELKPYVIAIGGKAAGTGFSNSIEEYDIGLGYWPEWQSTITNYQPVTHITDSMYIQGTLFRGVSEADGGNHCHIVSTDHPVMSLLRITGGNWQSNGGGGIMYMPQSSSWDQAHTCVHTPNPAQGYYMLWSIVNAIPCKWHHDCPIGTEQIERSTDCNPQLSVFPNPSTSGSGVHFRFGISTVNYGLSTVTIYDLSGRLVKRSRLRHPESSVKISDLEPGAYFYRISHEGAETKGKFVVL
jgi:hypothetical protein